MLDEIGRGTSTFDGVSIAWAVAEHLHDAIGCRTLFATHYHELQDLARERPAVRNLTVAVREVGEQVVFLRKLVQGGASRSYGIEVAKLAGLPAEVLARAREILRNLEAMEVDEAGHAALARGRRRQRRPGPARAVRRDPPRTRPRRRSRQALRALELDALRPLDALNLLAVWKKKLGGECRRGTGEGAGLPAPSVLRTVGRPYAFLWQSAHFWGPFASFLWQSWQAAWAFSLFIVLPKPSIGPPLSSLWHCVHFSAACDLWSKDTAPGLAGSEMGFAGAAADADVAKARAKATTRDAKVFMQTPCSRARARGSIPDATSAGL